MKPWVLERLVARARCEAKWLKLVISKLPTLADFYFLFEDFAPKVLFMRPNEDLGPFLRDLAQSYRDETANDDPEADFIDEFTMSLYVDGNATGHLQYYNSGVSWSAVPPGDDREVDELRGEGQDY